MEVPAKSDVLSSVAASASRANQMSCGICGCSKKPKPFTEL